MIPANNGIIAEVIFKIFLKINIKLVSFTLYYRVDYLLYCSIKGRLKYLQTVDKSYSDASSFLYKFHINLQLIFFYSEVNSCPILIIC